MNFRGVRRAGGPAGEVHPSRFEALAPMFLPPDDGGAILRVLVSSE